MSKRVKHRFNLSLGLFSSIWRAVATVTALRYAYGCSKRSNGLISEFFDDFINRFFWCYAAMFASATMLTESQKI
jgi:hypothetical protein